MTDQLDRMIALCAGSLQSHIHWEGIFTPAYSHTRPFLLLSLPLLSTALKEKVKANNELKEAIITKHCVIDRFRDALLATTTEWFEAVKFYCILVRNANLTVLRLIFDAHDELFPTMLSFFPAIESCRIFFQLLTYAEDDKLLAILHDIGLAKLCAGQEDLTRIITLANLTSKDGDSVDSGIIRVTEKGLDELIQVASTIIIAQTAASDSIVEVNISQAYPSLLMH